MHSTFLNMAKDILQELQEAFQKVFATSMCPVNCLGLDVQFDHKTNLKIESKPPPQWNL